nr:L,D-transpeptidase family protein [Methylomarinum sp. Ch1-1]MDP4523033.1 L,D-transpeptidase family protein [Methylomarinum sp. Ch1-1]
MLLAAVSSAPAVTLEMPINPGDSLVGDYPHQVTYATAKHEDTLLDIAREYDIGQNEIILANPNVDRWLPGAGTQVRIPTSHLLPDTPHKGLVLNLPEYRLYYYRPASKNQPATVTTHPISIGRVDWNTPLGKTYISAKTENPVWIPPKSIKEEHAAKGEILPDVFPSGPDNPLGLFALRLAIPGYLIHSTNKPYGVGMRVSHGCVRMYPEDIEKLYPQIKVRTPVYIVNQPIKVGWSEKTLYIEVHPDLEDDADQDYRQRLETALDLIEQANNGKLPVLNGAKLRNALEQSNGIPTAIFERPVVFDGLDLES